jgi:hypothetical protein
MYKLFDQKKYKGLSLLVAGLSVLSLILGWYFMVDVFGGGYTNLRWLSNFLMALMLSFLICELFVAPFFLLQDLLNLARKLAPKTSKKAPTRRNFLKKTALILGGSLFSTFIHGITRGKYNFTVHRKNLYFDDLPDAFEGFKVVQISDIHAGSFDNKLAVKRGFDLINAQNPDLILFTGDLVNSYASEIEPYLDYLKNLKANYGKFSVLGNHDYPIYKRMFDDEVHAELNFEKIKQHQRNAGFRLLMNEHQCIVKNEQRLYIAGVENWGRSRHFPKLGDLDKTIQGIEKDAFILLMSHDPTHWEDIIKSHPTPIQLTMSGHTHGMQMGIDLPVFKWSPIKYVYKHWAGLYQENNRKLYVNRGFGFLGFAGRIGIYPEISVFELRKKTNL